MQADAKEDIQGLIILAHGSRSQSWTAPFESIRDRLQARWSSGQVRLAYFEHSSPSLEEAAGDLVEQGCRGIRVEPLLLAPGFHVQTDLPRRLASLAEKYPDTRISAGGVLIDSEIVSQAIVEHCLAGIHRP